MIAKGKSFQGNPHTYFTNYLLKLFIQNNSNINNTTNNNNLLESQILEKTIETTTVNEVKEG
jgi:hypothetical protein